MESFEELYVALRDTFQAAGVNERAAIILARKGATRLRDAGILIAGEAAISRRTLDWEASRRIEHSLQPRIVQARKELEARPSFGDFFGSWQDFAHGLEETVEDIERGTVALIAALLQGTDVSPNEVALLWAILLGHQNITLEPPLLWQACPNSPIRLAYWVIAEEVMDWCALVATDWAMAADMGEGNAASQEFREFWQDLKELLGYLRPISHLQWDTAGIVGTIAGIDGLNMAWYPYALKFVTCINDLTDNDLTDLARMIRRFTLRREVEPTQALNLVGAVTRHILNGEPLRMHAMNHITAQAGDKTLAQRLAIAHPLVGSKAIQQWGQKARRAFGPRAHPLSDGDEVFLALVHEAGGEPGQRLPQGFWERFQELWVKRYPDKPMTINHLRVKYHRLVKRVAAP